MKRYGVVRETSPKDEALTHALLLVPRVDALGLPVEEETRRAAAGLLLAGFRVSKLSDGGLEGVVAYPCFEVEPRTEKREWDFYQRALKKKVEYGSEVLSNREQEVITEMEAYLTLERENIHAQLLTLLEEFYGTREEKSVGALERLEVVRTETGVNMIVPGSAPALEENARSSQAEEVELQERGRLFSAEVEKFGHFLAERYTQNEKTH